MIAGRLDRYITIEQPTYTVDQTTHQKKLSSWATYKTVWAALVNKQSSEVVEAGQIIFKNMHEFRIRYYDAESVKADMRISYNSDYYNIVGIKELGRKDGYLITTIRRDND